MRAELIRFGVALMATTAVVAAAEAQTTTCVNDVPNPYHMVNDWAHTPRPWAQTNNVFVDPKDNVWVFDRCQDGGCAGSTVAPIWELSPDGKVMKNFGSGYVFPHAVVTDKGGNIWIVDGQAKDGKGNQVVKLSPDGSKVLLTLGKAGASGKGLDEFDQPTSVAIAPNGDIFVAEGHAPTFGNSRIMKFDKDGKFLAAWKQFGRPSGIWIDRNDVLYVADSESEDAPGKDTNNPGCKRGVRIGSVKTGKVDLYIPPPPVSDPRLPPPEGVAADSHGNIYLAAVQAKSVY